MSSEPCLCLKVAASGDLPGGGAGVEDEAGMRDWEEGGRFSFEDSDRFEEDSLCSWSSEPESLCNNWRGWKRPPLSAGPLGYTGNKKALSEGTYLGTYNMQPYRNIPHASTDVSCPLSFVPFVRFSLCSRVRYTFFYVLINLSSDI